MRKQKKVFKKNKKGEQKSQNRENSPLCGGATCKPITNKFGMFVGLTDVVTFANNSNGSSRRPIGEGMHVFL